jgi:hypothetical protein
VRDCEAEGHLVERCLVLDFPLSGLDRSVIPMSRDGRDAWWQDALRDLPVEAAVEWVDAEDPLFKVPRQTQSRWPRPCLDRPSQPLQRRLQTVGRQTCGRSARGLGRCPRS